MFKRIALYLNEMFPPAHLIPSLLMSLSFFMAEASLHNQPLRLRAVLVAATLSITLFALMLRVMDEFKDYQDDLINYPERPLPSGRVLPIDLKVLFAIILGALCLLNSEPKAMTIAATGIFAFQVLMFKWFFMEKRIRPSLPLALYTHNPIVYFYFVYLFVAYSLMNPFYDLKNLLLAIPLGAGLTNWEISRKIRLPENETVYTTYSKIWGFKGALMVCLSVQAVILSGVHWFFAISQSPIALRAGFTAFYLILAAKYLQFMGVKTDPQGKWHKVIPMRKFAEYQALLVQCTLVVTYILKFYR